MDKHAQDIDALEELEIDLLLDALHQHCGYDFRQYARASIRRRARHAATRVGATHIAELIPRVLHDPLFAQNVLYDFSITVTEMFRDPFFYQAVRHTIVPYLKTFPFIRVWLAGCATGEEVYSLAILLKEEGVYERCAIFATDFNAQAVRRAQEGIYPFKDVQQYTSNYQRAGGTTSFADYYHAEYGSAIMRQELRNNITFVEHNLTSDEGLEDMHLIFCRNVLIYFDRTLQNRVLRTFAHSLLRNGFLCLGTKETLDYSEVTTHFKSASPEQRIYQKKVPA